MATQVVPHGAEVAQRNLHALAGDFRAFTLLFMMENGRYQSSMLFGDILIALTSHWWQDISECEPLRAKKVVISGHFTCAVSAWRVLHWSVQE